MTYNHNQQPQNNLKYSIPHNHHQKIILTFLRMHLSMCAAKMRQENVVLSGIKEDTISGVITNLLNEESRASDYLFRFEAKKGPDILIFVSPYKPFSNPLFVVEAKRLCSTSSNDYVKSGIRRFKTEEHGAEHNIAALLGYVQEKDFNHWFEKVNSWIFALGSDENNSPKWSRREKICKVQIKDIGEYRSKHPRIVRKPIILHHFWINLCNNNGDFQE